MTRKLTLRELYETNPIRADDDRRLFNWYQTAQKNRVDDHSRSDRKDGWDRAGNNRSVFSGEVRRSTKPPARAPGSDVADYDLSRNTRINRQGRPGLTGTSIPQPQYTLKPGAMDEEEEEYDVRDALEAQVQWAASYVADIEDEEERERTAVAFAEMFADSFGDNFHMLDFYEAAISTRH